MHTYMHTYIHTFIHTYITLITYIHYINYIHTYMHACIHTLITYIHTYMHAYIHTLITYIHAYIHTYMHAYIHTYIHTYTHTHIHTYMHACMHACIHTYIDTLIHCTCFLVPLVYFFCIMVCVICCIPWRTSQLAVGRCMLGAPTCEEEDSVQVLARGEVLQGTRLYLCTWRPRCLADIDIEWREWQVRVSIPHPENIIWDPNWPQYEKIQHQTSVWKGYAILRGRGKRLIRYNTRSGIVEFEGQF